MKRTPSGSFPLATLFLLVALCAILTGHLTPLLSDSMSFQGTEDLAAWTLISIFFGTIFGFLIGLYHYRLARGIAWGVGTGFVVGALCGPIGFVSTELPAHTLVISLGGVAILMTIAVGSRLMNNRDPSTQRDLYQRMLNSYQVTENPSPRKHP